jgi:hypothetical protein
VASQARTDRDDVWLAQLGEHRAFVPDERFDGRRALDGVAESELVQRVSELVLAEGLDLAHDGRGALEHAAAHL